MIQLSWWALFLVACGTLVSFAEAFVRRIKVQRHNHHGCRVKSIHTQSTVLYSSQPQQKQPPVIVVGKIIVDEYGDPSQSENPSTITVGGGAPQAAMGAALALVARDYLMQNEAPDDDRPPKPQPVLMLAPVGDLDFTVQEEQSLRDILQDALQMPPKLIRGPQLKTPRIRLWHDEEQVLQWYALNDSFENQGAGGLWGNYPSVSDYENLLRTDEEESLFETPPILHIIVEAGAAAPGSNGDSTPLLSKSIRDSISFLGVEPVTFPNEQGVITKEDAQHCGNLLQNIFDVTTTTSKDSSAAAAAAAVVSPDMALQLSMLKHNCLPNSVAINNSWAVRDGPRGSILVQYLYNPDESLGGDDPLVCPTKESTIPAATLQTLVNPTGAGNAYAAAFTALRGSGMDAVSSACIANSVGAVFCEYNHCPPYTWQVIERIAQASQQLQQQQISNERVMTRRYGEEQQRLKGQQTSG